MCNKHISIKKKLKYKIIQFLFNVCDSNKISNKTIGSWIKAIHYVSPLNAIISILYLPYWISTCTLLFVTIAGICGIYFNNCFLTSLERRLTGNHDDNITHIILELFDLEKNNKNEKILTCIVFFIYLPFVYVLYIYRYYKRPYLKYD